MTFNWYRIFNLIEFNSSGLISKEADVVIAGVPKTLLITKGVGVSILFDDVFLTLELNEKNPFRLGDRAVFLDENNDVWIGIFDAG